MKNRQLFPLGKAYEDAFCNRTEETKRLVGNILSCKHTLIIAPRRFGKSSLAEKAILESGLPSIKMNFHLCTSEDEVCALIVDNVIKLIGKSIGSVEKIITSIKKYITNLEPAISFGTDQSTLKLIPKTQVNASVVISEALLLLENLLREKKKKAVIFIDEFQEIAQISKVHAIEGAIRTAGQEMQNLSIIFSGSIRSLLLSMFEDENRPLYKLCRKIKLERISATDYEKHIQNIAINTWGVPLPESSMNTIISLTNRHPYYINYLCDSVWELHADQNVPNENAIRSAWDCVVVEEWSDALKELSQLALIQRRILRYIANNSVTNIYAQSSFTAINSPPSTVASAVNVLIKKDYIEQDDSGYYTVINPLLAAVLRGAEG